MGRLGSFVGGLVVGGIAVYTGLKYHVVRAEDGYHLIPKLEARFDEAYVDIRKFEFSDWNEHRGLAVALARSNKSYLMQESVTGSLRQSIDGVLRGLTKFSGSENPATPPPATGSPWPEASTPWGK